MGSEWGGRRVRSRGPRGQLRPSRPMENDAHSRIWEGFYLLATPAGSRNRTQFRPQQLTESQS
jgi:hypothetical protein